MTKRMLGMIAIAVGVAVLVVSVFAYQLGLGGACFGVRHVAGTSLGVMAALAGAALAIR